jgi:hypothetical protein
MTDKLDLGAKDQAIANAATALGIVFPEGLVEVWKVSNGFDLPGSWRLYPVYDSSNPKKSWGHIVYENTQAGWPYMADDLIAIASNDIGNKLVLRRTGSDLESTIYLWNHETNKISKWRNDFAYILAKAESRVASIVVKIERAQRKRRRGT